MLLPPVLRRVATAAALWSLALGAGPAAAQLRTSGQVTTTLGAEYDRGGLHRWLLGNGYRTLWATPVTVPVLDLAATAGGLTPVRKGGGTQTRSLRFAGADGRQYVFRSIRKDATAILPAELRETALADLLEDQMSTALPVGALLVAPVLEAAGVLHAAPSFVAMPDDDRLGTFRPEFGGMIGLFEERPRDDEDPRRSFAGALEVVSTTDLRKALERDPAIRVDAEAFLEARLTDLLLGDWDRHQDQWRWALLETDGRRRWVPVPRDRDQAFVRFDGVALGFARQVAPQLVKFGPQYSRLLGATWNGRDLDRELLVSLERPVWQARAGRLQAALTDSVLAAAVATLPPEWARLEGATILEALKARRDALPAEADAFYAYLAEQVDVWATDAGELVTVAPTAAGQTRVTIAPRDTPDLPWFARTFDPAETREVRLYLRGGRDSAVVAAAPTATPTVRIIGGGNDDRYVVLGRPGVRLYDDRGDNLAVGAAITTSRYEDGTVAGDPSVLPHRDWGNRRYGTPVLSSSPDLGLVIGWSGGVEHYGFRHRPWKTRLNWSVALSTGAETGQAMLDFTRMGENSSRFFRATLVGSGMGVLRWHGLGNDTERDLTRGPEFHRATQHFGRLDLAVGWQLGEHATIELGPQAAYSVAEVDDGTNQTRFLALDAPFGIGTFAQVGARARVRLDTRDTPSGARRGQFLEVDGVVWPAVLDVERGFGQLRARGATYFAAAGPGRPVLALQAGGTTTIGGGDRVPFHDLPTLGSSLTLRGFDPSRFAGHHAVHTSAELRLQLTSWQLVVPGQQGIFAFHDGGRVWARGESSDTWHTSVGGGVWFGAITDGAKLSAAVARSREGTRFHLDLGFGW